jgi:hypothetical protein
VRTAIVIGAAALTPIAAINAVSAVSNHYVRGYTARNGTLSSLTSKRTPMRQSSTTGQRGETSICTLGKPEQRAHSRLTIST